jgi:hypothetical protein
MQGSLMSIALCGQQHDNQGLQLLAQAGARSDILSTEEFVACNTASTLTRHTPAA